MRANFEDGEPGKFWQSRFKAVRLLDEEALPACAAYVDLNPIPICPVRYGRCGVLGANEAVGPARLLQGRFAPGLAAVVF